MIQRPIRIVVADDQSAVREGLCWLLQSMTGIDVVGQAANGQEAVERVAALRPDLVLLDLRMPVMDGIEATRQIRAEHPGTRVLILTTYDDDESIMSAVQAGASGYITKDADRSDIEHAIRAASAGQAVLDPGVYSRLVDAALRAPTELKSPGDLSARELDVLRLVARGSSNRAIAACLFISEATVKTHINHIFSKTGVSDRAAAVAFAVRSGIAGDL